MSRRRIMLANDCARFMDMVDRLVRGDVPDSVPNGMPLHLARCSDCGQTWRETSIRIQAAGGTACEEAMQVLYSLKFAPLEQRGIDPFEVALSSFCTELADSVDKENLLRVVDLKAEKGEVPARLEEQANRAVATLCDDPDREIAAMAVQVARNMSRYGAQTVIDAVDGRAIRCFNATLAAATGLLEGLFDSLEEELAVADLVRAKPRLDHDTMGYVEDAVAAPGRDTPSPRFSDSRFQATFLVRFHRGIPAGDWDAHVVFHAPVESVDGDELEGVRFDGTLAARPADPEGKGRPLEYPFIATFDYDLEIELPASADTVLMSRDRYMLRIVPRSSTSG